MKEKRHIVKSVKEGSIAEEMGIEPGDAILAIDNSYMEDVFDYHFLIQDTYIEVLIEKPDKEQWLLEIDKEMDEDLGIEFENGLMDNYRSCHNKCIFCFIDQMPKGMRETLYFKDDDSRLSFLQGNYVTLTNMSDHDVERICRYHLSPINISFQTMNPELRCMMLNNRFAGESLKKVDILNEAGIIMNGQIVLCKGVNDGAELDYSIKKMMEYIPNLQSVSVVPVGLSRHREGLYPLEPFDAKDSAAVIDMIEAYQKICYEKYGCHFIHASDEWYIQAGRDLPPEENYDGYLQLENGVGMIRLMINEFNKRLDELKSADFKLENKRHISVATGRLVEGYIKRFVDILEKEYPGLSVNVYAIRNDFFGERITVSGLICACDLMAQLKDKDLGEALLLPCNILRYNEDVFLDDVHLSEVVSTLQVPVNIVKSTGCDFVNSVLGID
ncbi:MAG: DUF512 domain-containing protein [Lachnospiraceae bacterium]|nr:DUF512 domain-containing protein [Lachnospiraceae bacterium]